jgi:pimeloyl-[acyl-carrier protein] synthase
MSQPIYRTTSGEEVVASWWGADPEDPAVDANPYPAFNRLRETHPVSLTPNGDWRLCRYADVVRLLRDVSVGVRKTDGLLPGQTVADLAASPGSFMLQQDPPTHTRLRKLVSKAFTPRSVESWRPRMEAITHQLLDKVAKDGEMDLIADLALPVPATLICELMGVPTKDRDSFTEWTADATFGLVTSRNQGTPEIRARVEKAGASLVGYFNDLFEQRQGELGDDLLSVLIAAEDDGDRLSHPELLSQSIGLLIAGFETTIGLIGNGLTELIRHPDELAKLRDRPELIESAVEECLRFAGPILLTVRILHEDAEFGDIVIPKDSQVFAGLAPANRDPEYFTDPDRFDVERYAGATPATPHLSFGGGTHLCLGAHLARLESQIAIGAIAQRFDEMRLLEEKTEWGRSLFRVPARVPIAFRAVA